MTSNPTPGRFHYSDPRLERIAAEQAGDREVKRLAMLPTRPTINDAPDPNAPTPTPADIPIDEWMARERQRQARREKARLAADVPRDGQIDIGDRARAANRTRGW